MTINWVLTFERNWKTQYIFEGSTNLCSDDGWEIQVQYSVVAKFIEAGDVKVFMLIKESMMNVTSISNYVPNVGPVSGIAIAVILSHLWQNF